MPQYQYRMVQISPAFAITKRTSGQEIAQHVQQIVNQVASEGWEFYRIDPFQEFVNPGCLGALFGAKASTRTVLIATFRAAI